MKRQPISYGVLHKYKTRFLLTLTGACAVHCRYCFRRHFPYQENLPKNEDWPAIKNYILSQPEVHEIILSGGDPLTLSNRKLGLWLERLESIPQIDTLRIHSRVPIVIPDRIDHELISLWKTVGYVLYWWYTLTMLQNSMTSPVQNCMNWHVVRSLCSIRPFYLRVLMILRKY